MDMKLSSHQMQKGTSTSSTLFMKKAPMKLGTGGIDLKITKTMEDRPTIQGLLKKVRMTKLCQLEYKKEDIWHKSKDI